jgi:uncharacterized protein (DUF983 family)
MINKGSKLYSIFTGTCPKCHEESMYVNPNPYVLSEIFEMHKKCSNCGKKYRIEPYFFYVSMYVSYGVGVAFAVAAFVISYVFMESSLVTAVIVVIITLIAFSPIIMRLSRNIWINIFIHFDKSFLKEK